MTKKLFVQAIVKYLAGVVLLGLLIFLPAGTLRFPNGWLLMALLFIPMLGAGIVTTRRCWKSGSTPRSSRASRRRSSWAAA